jgi:hypothetical protein
VLHHIHADLVLSLFLCPLGSAGAQLQQHQQVMPQDLLREQKWSSLHQQQQQATAIPRFMQMLAACQIRVW